MHNSARESSNLDPKNTRFKPGMQKKRSVDGLPPSAILYDKPRDEYVAIFQAGYDYRIPNQNYPYYASDEQFNLREKQINSAHETQTGKGIDAGTLSTLYSNVITKHDRKKSLSFNHDFVIDEEDRVHAEYNGPVQYSSNLNDGNFLHISSSLNEENPLQKESAN